MSSLSEVAIREPNHNAVEEPRIPSPLVQPGGILSDDWLRSCDFGPNRPRILWLGVREKFNPIQIKRAVAHLAGDPHRLFSLRRQKLQFELSSHRQICDCEE